MTALEVTKARARDLRRVDPRLYVVYVAFALVADKAYELGRAMATASAYGILGKKAPAFVVAPAITITKQNLVKGYHESLHRAPPKSVLKALGK